MTSVSRASLALFSALALAACSGGSDDGDGTLPPVPPATFGSLVSDFDGLFDTYATAVPVTTPGQMPVSGSARYDGQALFSSVDVATADIIARPTSASNIALTADFADLEVGGRLYDFRSADPNVQMAGELAIANGQITNNVFDGDVQGTLTVNGTPVDYGGGDVIGNFLGSNAEAVSGLIVQGSSPTRYNGVFVAER